MFCASIVFLTFQIVNCTDPTSYKDENRKRMIANFMSEEAILKRTRNCSAYFATYHVAATVDFSDDGNGDGMKLLVDAQLQSTASKTTATRRWPWPAGPG